MYALVSFAQVPHGMNLQMVVRDAGSAPMPNEQVGLRFTLVKDSLTGTPVYQETQIKTSNQFGLINTILGIGTVTVGNYSAIAWTDYPLYLKQELDMQNGQGYLDMGTTPMMTVPYSHLTGGMILESPDGTDYHLEVDDDGILITVVHIAPEGGFYADVLTGEAPLLVTFTDSSTNNPTSWQWDFGDGGTSSVQNPTHEYTTAGTYTVSLTVSNAYGTDTEVKTDYIEVLPGGCPSTVTDTDGNTYSTILIGDQCWMQENLKVTHYPNGDVIPYITDNDEWVALADNNTDDAYCYYDNNLSSEFGALYSYAAAIADNWTHDNNNGQGICPDGWHLPTDAEWTVLIEYLGGSGVAGGKMKESGFAHWNSPNTGATNESGLTALPGGSRYSYDGVFRYSGSNGYWWSATERSSSSVWYRSLGYDITYVTRIYYSKSGGYSVRCLWDE